MEDDLVQEGTEDSVVPEEEMEDMDSVVEKGDFFFFHPEGVVEGEVRLNNRNLLECFQLNNYHYKETQKTYIYHLLQGG